MLTNDDGMMTLGSDMNAGYTKLFGDIVTSTIWQQPNDCKVLWITMLALKDRDHICRATVPGLARMADVSIDAVEKYLEMFQKPDKYSRSQEFEGRRIEAIDGGWKILNGEKYQDRMNPENRREQLKKAAQRYRQKAKEIDREERAKARAGGKTIRPEHRDDGGKARKGVVPKGPLFPPGAK